jgi:hypothetical protein
MKINYKRLYKVLSMMAVAFIIGMFYPYTANSRIETNTTPDLSADQLRAVVVEDFEDEGKVGGEEGWRVVTEPKELKDSSKKEKNPIVSLEYKIIQGKPNDLKPEDWASNNKGTKERFDKCFGMKFQFKYPGFNSVHIEPPVITVNKEKKRAIPLPGKARAISMWVHGRGHDYNLECWVEDYRGNVHIVKMGSTNFIGWRPLKGFIPITVPQVVESYPQTRFTKIIRFVLRANPDAGTEEVFYFFDQMKVLTDEYESNFDGQKLHEAFNKDSKEEDKGGK